jgi:nucleotide-binding universal stress UspA family protein
LRVLVVRVVEPFTLPSGTPLPYRSTALKAVQEINKRRHHQASRSLSSVVAKLRSAGFDCEAELRTGEADLELEGAAMRHGSDLILVGSRKPSAKRHYLLGSTAEKLVRHSPISVLVVR